MEVTQMVTNRIQHSDKKAVKQGSGAVAPEPNKIGASTPIDFSGKNLTPYGGLLPVATMLEKLGFPGADGGGGHGEAAHQGDERLPVLARHGVGPVHRVQSPEPTAVHCARSDADGGFENCTVAAAVHAVALSGSATRERGPADSVGARPDAPPRMGSGEREAEDRDIGHRYDGAHAVRAADGCAQELQPEEQGEEKLPADTDVSGGDAGIPGGRVAQWRPADGGPDRPSFTQRFPFAACGGGENLRARRFGLLLLGGRGSLPKGGLPVHRGGAQDLAASGRVEPGAMEAVAKDRRRCRVRIPLPAGRMGPGVPLRGSALREESGRSGGWRG